MLQPRGGSGLGPDRRLDRLASKASPSPSTTVEPQRVVSFISVVGCNTFWTIPIRANCRQVIESDTSRHSNSYPSSYRNLREHQPQVAGIYAGRGIVFVVTETR